MWNVTVASEVQIKMGGVRPGVEGVVTYFLKKIVKRMSEERHEIAVIILILVIIRTGHPAIILLTIAA